MSEESVPVNMQEFAFKPKERLPTVSRYSQLHSLPLIEVQTSEYVPSQRLQIRFLKSVRIKIGLVSVKSDGPMMNYIHVLLYLLEVWDKSL